MQSELSEDRRRFLAYFAAAGLSSTLLPGVLWAQTAQQQASKITLEMLKTAEVIAGLEFTDAERQILIDGVNQHLADYEKVRALPLDNSVVSSLRFSPVLAGMKFDTVKRPMKMSRQPAVTRRFEPRSCRVLARHATRSANPDPPGQFGRTY